jgi:serine/threonine-protein phosphatase 6 regulatory ankyrin repeat subunit B
LTSVHNVIAATGSSGSIRAAARSHILWPLLSAAGAGDFRDRAELPAALLLTAVRRSMAPKLQWLLAHHAGEQHPATLAVACLAGCTQCVAALLATAGVDVNRRLTADDTRHTDPEAAFVHETRTPLMLACEAGHLDCARLLIDRGARVNLVDQEDFSALMAASSGGHIDLVRLLIDRRADVNAKTDFRFTPLMLAAEIGSHVVLDALITAGADVDAVNQMPNDDAQTALMLAASRGHVECVALITAGCQIDHRTPNVPSATYGDSLHGLTTLILAVVDDHLACVQALVRAGADVHQVDSEGRTAEMLGEGNASAQWLVAERAEPVGHCASPIEATAFKAQGRQDVRVPQGFLGSNCAHVAENEHFLLPTRAHVH